MSRDPHRPAIGVVLVAALTLSLAPASAEAAATVGQSPPTAGFPDVCLHGSNTFNLVQVGVADGNSYVVPSAGVITRWRTSLATGSLIIALRVFTGSSPTLTPVADSTPQAIVPGGPTDFDTRIPVSGGELVGIQSTGGSGEGCYYNTNPSPADRWLSDMAGPIGTPQTYTSTNTGARVNVAAVLEPDCDSDGFGDETQDQDVLACGTPNTTITKGPKDKTKKKQATFEFSSDIPASTFECKLDTGAFAPCASPHTVEVGKGKHSFQVQGKTATGNTDASPAGDDWKVKKKRKKRR